MAIQLVMAGQLRKLKTGEDGKQALSAAFNFAADVAVAPKTRHPKMYLL
ncbi:hypothetical protein LB545_20080 [Mesorhizobium sp. BR1-1-6]|nr:MULTISPECIES: hypothetical protein [unclassified Mesorhizobium]MBZ9896625.1 hypothetical protein [Mesorhizobium sp. BR1-1-6]MBZ9921391.1 hypothetical protein [Mesorhizobium sp. BR1-1-7]MBZ9970364.1 hypothetical protein [Mesorhizobium sp. BR1-1-12]MBZ9981308.1 hypothetical protein [Mesorhizobium sp. BR-1-1-8]